MYIYEYYEICEPIHSVGAQLLNLSWDFCPPVLGVSVFFQSNRCDILNIVSLQFSLQGEEWGHMRPKVWLTLALVPFIA